VKISLFPANLINLDLRNNPINEEDVDRLVYIVETPGYDDDTDMSYIHPLASNPGGLAIGGMNARKPRKTRKTRKPMKCSRVNRRNKSKKHHFRLE
jgi:hypothetical protein